jgi:hypothetical protein
MRQRARYGVLYDARRPFEGSARRTGTALRSADRSQAQSGHDETDIVAYLSALLRLATGGHHELTRSRLFGLIGTYLRANIAAIRRRRRLLRSSAFRKGLSIAYLPTARRRLSATSGNCASRLSGTCCGNLRCRTFRLQHLRCNAVLPTPPTRQGRSGISLASPREIFAAASYALRKDESRACQTPRPR